jgi:cell division protein FtsL
MRYLNLFVIAALVIAAAYVYEIKFETTLQAERLAKLRSEIRRERDAIAVLRAEWAKVDSPARIQSLARRHLALQPIVPTQIDNLDQIPERPVQAAAPAGSEPAIESEIPTSGVGKLLKARR